MSHESKIYVDALPSTLEEAPKPLWGNRLSRHDHAVADNDDKRDPAAKDKLKEAFTAAHLKAKVEVYEGCNHGWTVRGSQVYNEVGAERAWAELTALYKRNLA